MPQALIAAATAAAKWIGGQVYVLAAKAGIGHNLAASIALAAEGVTKAAIYAGAQAGVQALLAPEVPSSEAGKTALQQTMPPRQYVLYLARVSGPYMFWEARKRLYDVIAFADQQLDHYGTIWLHDDRVTLDANDKVIKLESGAYGGHGVWIFTRLGLPTETSYTVESCVGGGGSPPPGPTIFSELGDGVWTADHRGDGIASGCLVAMPIEQEYFHRVFPNGYPVLSIEAFAGVHDFRDVAEDPEDVTTWAPNGNCALVLAHYLTGLDPVGKEDRYDALIAPFIARWTTAADDCDDLITLAAGGSEPRYTCGGMFTSATHDAEVLPRILESCNGWLFEHGDGSFDFEVGVFREPDFTLTAEHIKSIEWIAGRPAERAVNELAGSYNSIAHDYSMVPAQAWRDEAAILEMGQRKPEPFPTPWVHTHGQHRRLAKQRMIQLNPDGYGSVIADLAGLNAWGKRYIKLQVEDGDWDALETAIDVEIIGRPRFNPNTLSVEFDCVRVDGTALNAWDPETEEGVAPDPLTDLETDGPVIPATPSITGVTQDGNQLIINLSGLATGANVSLRWREEGSENWFTQATKTPSDLGGGTWQFTSSAVPLGADLELGLAAVLDGEFSDYSEPPTPFTTTGGA